MAESTATDDGGYAVELIGITKRFPGVVANDDIHLRVRSGEVHALCGENGAGKSTLMKILYGMQQPDEGTIRVDGADVAFRSPADAIRVGIGMVHQHFMLADNLTVAENVLLGAEAAHGIGARARARIAELGRTVGLRAEPDVLLERLGVADRQRVEILKVLYRGARTVILDEPTAVLVPQEVDELFATLRGMQAEGYTFLFISHKLDEVRAIADSITVIRRGTSVGTADPRTVTSRELAEMMVGSELPDPGTRESTVTDREVLRVEGLTLAAEEGRPLLADVDLVVHAGEVLGIAGVEGNGQTELVETIMGMRHATAGRIVLDGRDLSRAGTLARREAGIGYIPEDRTRHGLLGSQPLWANRILGHQTRPPVARPGRLGLLDLAAARRDTERIVAEFDVRTPGVDVPAAALSGGNQQKLVVGRELSGDPVLLIASHPTRGVDVGAQAGIWEELRKARAAGLAVLLISADLDELIGLSDSIAVILRGRLVATADPATVTPEELGAAMTGAGDADPVPTGADPDPTAPTPAHPIALPPRPPRRTAPAERRRGVRRDEGAHRPAAARARGAVRGAAVRRRAADQRRQPADRAGRDDHAGRRGHHGRRHRQQRRRLLPRRARRGDRLPDEAVQHRDRGPVPARRLRRRDRRRRGGAAAGAAHPRDPAGGRADRRGLGRDRGVAQGLPRGQRGHLDDHAELRGHRSDRLPDQHRQLRRVARQQHLHPADRPDRPGARHPVRRVGHALRPDLPVGGAGRGLLVPARAHALRVRPQGLGRVAHRRGGGRGERAAHGRSSRCSCPAPSRAWWGCPSCSAATSRTR